ncbi:hypothetical protein QCA50_017197 [Cerrena zonata]|uniref:Programmed cell death protein 5 n=1 Tax=Cerrena zonata TaxID=2478898 RepID=A0AAW0FL73_9APHY
MDDSELNAIRQARLAELQKSKPPANDVSEMKVSMLSQALENSARERLSRVRIVRPDRAEAVENYIVKLISMGSIARKLTEDDIVEILQGLSRDEKTQSNKIVFNRRDDSDIIHASLSTIIYFFFTNE